MKVTVFGLGYVGCVTAALLAKDGHIVVGVDVSHHKVDLLNAGSSPVLEPGLDEVIKEVVGNGSLSATMGIEVGLEKSDVSLICVGTPSSPNGAIDLQFVKQVAGQIGENLEIANPNHTIVVRSTVLPGSTRDHVIPAVEATAKKKVGHGYEVCTNPEFLREGTSLTDYYSPPRILVGERVPGAGDIVHKLYEAVDSQRYSVPLEVAEGVKYSDNAFHALKVAFANEMGRVWEAAGADGKEVMRIVAADTKLNISPVYMRPGFAFGGSCLPKDLRAVCHAAKTYDVDIPVLENVTISNEAQIDLALKKIKQTKYKKIALIGLAFKSDTDDLRESPYLVLAKTLIGEGCDLSIYDPIVHSSTLLGSNKEFLFNEIPHISKLLVEDLHEATENAELILIGHSLPDDALISEWERNSQTVIRLS